MLTDCVGIVRFGAPDVLEAGGVEVGSPGPGEVLVRHTGIGVIEAVGPGVEGLAPGERVTHANVGIGSYVGHRVMPADRMIRIPDALDDDVVAASSPRGLTCHYLLRHRGKAIAATGWASARAARGPRVERRAVLLEP